MPITRWKVSSLRSRALCHCLLFKRTDSRFFPTSTSRTICREHAILLHSNLLSCCIPRCGNATAKASIIAIGNRLQRPKGKFPAWVSTHEQDPLFWVSGTDGMSLVQKISGAASCFALMVGSKLGCTQLLRVMSRWQIGPATHLWVVKGIISSCLMYIHPVLIGSGLLDVPSVLGPLHLSADIGNRKRLFTEQCSHPDGGVLVLVQSFVSFSCSEALDDGR